MRKIRFLILAIISTFVITACSSTGGSTPDVLGIIKPGETIGEYSLQQGSPDLPYYYFRYFCDFVINVKEPITNSIDCEVPSVSGLVIDIGWLAKESKFSSNWDNIEWELYIDGYQIALEEFSWFDFDHPAKLENNKSRSWLIDLKDLYPGKHNIRLVQNFKNPVDDGFNTYQPGKYEFVADFIVLDEIVYPEFSAVVPTGQNKYSSESAEFDFLYYLPEDYFTDPQKSWPLLIYLHGTRLRGGTLELLLEEPLPRILASEKEFPFIVVSPIGDGGYQFWIEDNMTASLFSLLDEIQSQYAIDKNRIYLIGDGMGGNGVWHLGLNYPGVFAALVPIGGYIGYPFEVPKNMCDLVDIPVWVFHGGKDVNVPASVEQELVDKLNACGGDAKISISDDMTINILYNVYKNPELYDWLLQQAK